LTFARELKGQVVLLDFWTYCCINCMHVLPDLAYLEEKYKDEPFLVIGVHSAKFDNEGHRQTVRAAIGRYEIHHPVIVDEGMSIWSEYAIRSWPTLVLVGADVFGQTLDAEHVHRPELVSALSGAALGTPITPEIVARVLAHPEGGRKGVPAGARVVALINKVERLPDRTPARETAERLLREPAIESVMLTALRGEEPVLEICTR